ncbi:hypothetical protein OSB04_011497 [Centaurea solstitialis]|uniref:BTB domain-containing protein n=1 Tax=Centaurea solstitialis TaxID=347529 RepID=A0AA38TUA5_9ASTR|nr:hypothetical protein OSB04_011497 [Centaurea solstitialis]
MEWGWGYKRFLRRAVLETSDYLKDDCLLVKCTVGVVKSCTEGPQIFSISSPPSDICQHFGHLLESGELTDVNLNVDGEVFRAHKLVLAARSPVFKAQLFGPMKDNNTDCINIQEIKAPVFKSIPDSVCSQEVLACFLATILASFFLLLNIHFASIMDFLFGLGVWVQVLDRVVQKLLLRKLALLHFIYWDKLPDMEEVLGLNPKLASTLMAQHLLAAADQYGIERLRFLCETKLCEDVAINTVATTLALAEQHHCFQLKSVCLKFVAEPENLKAVMQSDGFDYLTQSCPCVITELLEYVARIREHSVTSYGRGGGNDDGSGADGRRVRQRIY